MFKVSEGKMSFSLLIIACQVFCIHCLQLSKSLILEASTLFTDQLGLYHCG